MAAMGWRVTVVADGHGPSEAPPGVTVRRTGGGPADAREPSGDARLTVRGYLAAAVRLIQRALRLPRHDVVVTMTDPPLLACAGPLIAARHGAASIHWSQDVFPACSAPRGLTSAAAWFDVRERPDSYRNALLKKFVISLSSERATRYERIIMLT